MKIPFYHIDAFTDKIFSGNPAAVCYLPKWLPEEQLNAIAKENNLPATAFLVPDIDNPNNANNLKPQFNIRWITPEYELDICGHGTLAAAFVIFNFIEPNLQRIELRSPKEVFLVMRQNDLITLCFPVKQIEEADELRETLAKGLGRKPNHIYQHGKERCLVVFENEEEVRELKPNLQVLKSMEHRGIIVTAPGNDVDYVSRTFYPQKTMSEDQATGSSNCLLVPYWRERLNKTKFHAKQVSARGGEMFCEYRDDRIFISGQAVMYLKGEVDVAIS